MHTQKTTSPHPKALIGIDLDGTLLNDQNQISLVNKTAIHQAISSGIAVTLISGRSFCSMIKFVESIPLNTPCCGAGGAVIFEPLSGKILRHLPLALEECKAILTAVENLPVTIFCHEHKQIFYQNSNATDIQAFQHQTSCRLIECVNLLKNYNHIPTKITLVGDNWLLVKIRESILEERPKINAYLTAPTALEFTQQGAHKGTALQYIAELLGVDPSKTVAIGDEENDIVMLAAAKIGVAMGNATDGLKKQADYIAPFNQDDGVAWVFQNVVPKLLLEA